MNKTWELLAVLGVALIVVHYTRATNGMYASGFDPSGQDTTTRGGYGSNGTNGTWNWNPLYTGPRGR